MKTTENEGCVGAGRGRVRGAHSQLVSNTNENVMKGIMRALLGLWWLCIQTQQPLNTSPSDTNFYPGTLLITPFHYTKRTKIMVKQKMVSELNLLTCC